MRQYQISRRPHGLLLRTALCCALALLFLCAAVPTVRAASAPSTVYLGGMPFGVKLHTQGVLVVGVSEVEGATGRANPAYAAGIRPKDVITHINDTEVNTVAAVTHHIEEGGGKPLRFTVTRKGKTEQFTVTPIAGKDGHLRCGLWIRDNTAGIGTVTFILPKTGAFAGLGHGICDADTGALMPLLRGYVADVTLSGIVRGSSGHPGELKGHFHPGKTGALLANTPQGVFGVFSEAPKDGMTEIPVASAKEVTEGEAQIFCTLSDTVKAYTVRITKLNRTTDLKNFVIEVTDPALLEATGGIVQGMSGSPIVQNGKLIGAVTHVFINDPTQGYGILIENMLSQMGKLAK